MYRHQTQWKYIKIIGNFNEVFILYIWWYISTKQRCSLGPGLHFVDTHFSVDFENTSEIKAGD